MEKQYVDIINVISNIMKKSIQFDNALKSGHMCVLKQLSSDISKESNKLQSLHHVNKKYLDICDKINKINEYSISYLSKQQPMVLLNNKNTLLLFYSENCLQSKQFMKEWSELQNILSNKINLLSINCDNVPKNRKICECLKVKYTNKPIIKYVTPTKVHDYNGSLNVNDILQSLLIR